MTRRIQRGSVTKDLYYHLVRSSLTSPVGRSCVHAYHDGVGTGQTDEEGLEPTKPSMSVVSADGTLAIIAGADTTATTLSALIYYLLLHPEMAARLRAEIDEFFPHREEPVDSGRMAGMSYLNACMWVVSVLSLGGNGG